MAGLVPAIHVEPRARKDVDAAAAVVPALARRANHIKRRIKRIALCPALAVKIFIFRFSENHDLLFRIPRRHEGRTRRHERGAECGGRERAR